LLDPNDGTFSNFSEGYITLAENNHPDLGALPVSLHVIKIVKDKYRGAIKTVFSDNAFDEKITLRNTADFGANPNDLIFQWWYREQDGTNQATPDIMPDKWLIFPDFTGNDGKGMSEISLSGAGAVLLVDNLFYTRYRHVDSNPDDPESWSDWAGAANSKPGNYQAQLAEGWVKRVLNTINPFEARVSNFFNSESPATYVSMVQQAGPRYEGPVAFNPEKDVIENVGLIELYQTVLERAKDLSIDLEQPVCTSGITTALLMAATRVSGFYMLLGNEAYNDALDPTIGYGTDSIEYGSLAPTIFTFMNQLPDLINEEFALLCGRSENGARPAYNRLLWNFTKGNGEVAYAMSYNINDVNLDGFIDEADARTLYPQGHGDAWGHYLTAVKCYYDLLGHPYFNWESRSEKFSIEGVVIDVDYMDERKFAEVAAAKAKVGSEVVNMTYRNEYVEDPDGQWQGYQDSDEQRAWGVSGWATRTYLASLFDWAMANAILPAKDTNPSHIGIKKIDRSSVPEILEIASQARNVQVQFDNANNGLNPLGLVSDAVPFDINPSRMIPGVYNSATHFEQSYEHAIKALENARAIFDHANEIKDQIRRVTVTEQDFTIEVMDQDRQYRNQLIELFGTPYEGTIGAGKAYPPGYKGPDYYYYNYIDVNEVSEETIPPPSEEMIAFFKPIDVSYKVKSGDGDTVTEIPAIYKEFFNADLEGSEYMGTDFSDVVEITFPMSTGKYSFHAPESWGLRQSPGEIQLALIELIKAESDLQLALFQYSEVIGDISDTMALVQGRSDLLKSELEIASEWSEKTEMFNDVMIGLQTGAEAAEIAADFIDEEADAAAEFLPKSVGMSNDTTAPMRGTIKVSGNISSKILRIGAFAARTAASVVESKKELAQIEMEKELNKASYRHDIQQYLEEVEGLLGREAPARVEIFKRREHMRQVSERYRTILSKGLRLLEERKVYNARVAQKTQGKRYMDMAFRVNLNQALSKYRNAFDLASRYVYLAAKAYDYETNLSDRDPVAATPLLTKIIRQRHLGQYENDQYLIGQGGLGEILATLKTNFDVLKSQMGFNTPQTETGRFSLRTELFRIKQGAENRNKWQDELKNKYVEDLWSIPEFRNYCRPFAEQGSGEQPGIVINFGTKIIFGKNFFGWPLSGGDHAYDPTNFATKVRSVGVWFEGYDNSLLSETPRVYLIPTGMDVMLVPNSLYLDTREWSIIDQKLPLPLPVQGTDLTNPDWIPSLDSLDGSMIKIRRFSSFRAYHDSGYFNESQVSYESRLIGRSVWNSRWMLIIPGGTFHYDQDYGIKMFIENVSDIKLFFQTYAISGG
ncbi:MAG: TolC family protein, partial [Candidatus Magnetomorum sp.]|nr:TolC family protein [Candidatus Magnetomorum sp.]